MSLTTVDSGLISSGAITLTTQVTGTLPEANGGTGTTVGYYGFKNRIINGAMVIDQRNAGASFTIGNFGYGIDRWSTQAVTALVTGQQVTGSTGNNKALRITGASGNTIVQVSQRIESVNIYDCASQSVTVSFTLSGSTSGSVSVRFLYPTATDNYTSFTEPVAGTSVSFTTTPTQYTVSRTLDANANKGVWVLLDFGAVGAGVTRTLEFFQLEKGSTATSFDYRPYGTELALCQRYYYVNAKGATSLAVALGFYSSATNFQSIIKFAMTMRATPTASIATGTNYYTVGSDTMNGFSVAYGTPESILIFNNTEASGTTGVANALLTNNASASVAFDAEL